MWSVRISIQRNMKGNVTIGGHRCQQFEENGYFRDFQTEVQYSSGRGSMVIQEDPRSSSRARGSSRGSPPLALREAPPPTRRGVSPSHEDGGSGEKQWTANTSADGMSGSKSTSRWNLLKYFIWQFDQFDIFPSIFPIIFCLFSGRTPSPILLKISVPLFCQEVEAARYINNENKDCRQSTRPFPVNSSPTGPSQLVAGYSGKVVLCFWWLFLRRWLSATHYFPL